MERYYMQVWILRSGIILFKFSFLTYKGIFMGSTNSGFINCVARSHDGKFLCSGCDDDFLNVYNCPCIKDNPNVDRYV